MTVNARELAWFGARRSFDALVERVRGSRLSFDDVGLLRDSHWHLGEDALLRDDNRFRMTPWQRWILSETFLANDALCARLHHERRSAVVLESALAELDEVVRRRCVVCAADPRLVVEHGEVRLSARELTDQPLLEQTVGELERYVTHLPLHSLRAAAASEPAGEWGPRAQEQVIDTLGWVKVEFPGRRLTPMMFVAQIAGRSMDDGRSGLVDGCYAVFELWPSGTKQNLNVLVRGAFTDPETGSFAIKKYVADVRGADGRHQRVKLVSLNPDRDRFPDIELESARDDDVTVVAKVVHALTPRDFARLPRPRERRGRRDIVSGEAHADIARQLEEHVERFFESDPIPSPGEAPRTDHWATTLVCLDAAAGGLHVEVGPLRGLWSFVKRLRASGSAWDVVVPASNLRERPTRIAVPAASGPWRFSAIDFEDDPDVDLSKLHVEALRDDRASVFRVDGDGIGRLQHSGALSPGQRYRLVVPAGLIDGADVQRFVVLSSGWLMWELEFARAVPTDTIELARKLGLSIGEPAPGFEWVVAPPVAWRFTTRGESYASFAASPGPVAQFRESHVEVDGEAAVFLHGTTGTVTHSLPAGEMHLVHLGALAPGRYVLALVHHRTAVAPVRVAFEVIEEAPATPNAMAAVALGEELYFARPGETVRAPSRDFSDADGATAIESLRVSAPPGWPVRLVWRELVEETLQHRATDDDGTLDSSGLLAGARERFIRRPIGDVVFDFRELGRVALLHDRHREPDAVRGRVSELLATRGTTVERLAGAYSDLLSIWFEPVCAALGFDVRPMPDGRVAEAPEHATVLRLFHVERRGARIESQLVRLLVLVEHLNPALSPQMLTWIDETCAQEGLRDTLLSDGFRWATHRRASRLALRLWDLKAITSEPENFVSFLHVASEGV
jgi:hypothetical protein